MFLSKLNDIEDIALRQTAENLSVKPDWLYSLIDFESRWNPAALNETSGARGLIQFLPSTARSMGYLSANDLVEKNPDRVSQLIGPVYEYLKKYAPFPSEQSLCMAVFYPAYRSVPLDTIFPDTVTRANPGIVTPRDYIKLVFGSGWMPAAAIVAMICFALLLVYSQKG